jgi:hypothetical protein
MSYLLKLYGVSHSSFCQARTGPRLRLFQTTALYGRVRFLKYDGMSEELVGPRVAAVALNNTVRSFVMLRA